MKFPLLSAWSRRAAAPSARRWAWRWALIGCCAMGWGDRSWGQVEPPEKPAAAEEPVEDKAPDETRPESKKPEEKPVEQKPAAEQKTADQKPAEQKPDVKQPEAEPAIESAQAWQQEVRKLIGQLGHTNFFVRESAQSRLARLGYDAVDALTQAQNHEDLEIAKRSTYLLRGLKAEFKQQLDQLRNTAAADVKLQLDNYENENEVSRRKRIDALVKMGPAKAAGVLAKLVQYEQSSHLSREAALGALKWKLPPGEVGDKLAQGLEQELGGCLRSGAEWIRMHLLAQRDPAKAWPRVQQAAQAELDFIHQAGRLTSETVALELLGYQVELAKQLKLQREERAVMMKMIALEQGESKTLAQLIDDLFADRDFETLDEVAVKFSGRVNQNAPLLYRLAEARLSLGKKAEADELAQSALALSPADRGAHFRMAHHLGQRGLWDWSQREFEALKRLGLDQQSFSLSVAGDPDSVRAVMEQYFNQGVDARRERIFELFEMNPNDALPALCRLARFEPDAGNAELAAACVLNFQPVDDLSWPKHAATIRSTVGPGDEPAVRWLTAYAQGRDDPSASAGVFDKLIAEENQRLASKTHAAHGMLGLLHNRMYLALRLKQPEQALEQRRKMADLSVEDPATVEFLLDVFQRRRDHLLIEQLAERQPAAFRGSPLLMFQWAAAVKELGRTNQFEDLTSRAKALIGDDMEKNAEVAFNLSSRGLTQLAFDEYQRMVERLPPVNNDSLNAKVRMASLLEDQEKWDEAAAMLENVRSNLEEGVRDGSYSGVPTFVQARLYAYHARRMRAAGDAAKEISNLEMALEFSPQDADLLIALHRATSADPARRRVVVDKIAALADMYREQMASEPANSLPCNQLAWLLCNTTGDFEEAKRASLKSLELRPGTGSYLDTLAHCHHALKEYEKAVNVQEMAVELEPYSIPLRRQLAVFQADLAAHRGSSQPPGE